MPPAHRLLITLAATLLCLSATAQADESAIRKNLTARLPTLPPIDEVTQTPMPGLWEVRMGSEVVYTDDTGHFVIQGHVIDTTTRANLTEERITRLTAFEFGKLPLKDAVSWKRGTGARKLVVFADPNCGFCKRFERELNNVPDITVYTFLIPILGGDSPEKSRAIWCARDKGKVWRSWMIDGTPPPSVAGRCDTTALDRNLALGQKHAINGTPSLVFENNERVPGILAAPELEKKFAALNRKT